MRLGVGVLSRVLALVGLGAIGTVAVASATVLESSVRVTPKDLGTSERPVGLQLRTDLRFMTPEGVDSPLVTRVRLRLPRPIEFNGGDYWQCSRETIEGDGGVASCHRQSLVGAGTGYRLEDDFGMGARFTIVNGGPRTLWAFTTFYFPALLRVPARIAITKVGKPRWSQELDLRFPEVLYIIAGQPAMNLDGLRLAMGGKPYASHLFGSNRACPGHGSLPYRATVTFLGPDGQTFEREDRGRIGCKAQRRRPPALASLLR
jgi:hypothetical protein